MARPVRAPAMLRLRLYVAGSAPNSVRARANLDAICREHFADRYALEVVDVLAQPARALADGVLVTPTLVRLLPEPIQRVVGNMSDKAAVLLALGGV